MLPVLTAPIAVPSVARIGEPDIPEAITRSSCTESKPPSCETAQSSHSPASDTTRAGAVPPLTRGRGALAREQSLRATAWGRRNGEGLDGVDHPLIGLVLLAQVLTVRRSEQRNVGDRVDEYTFSAHRPFSAERPYQISISALLGIRGPMGGGSPGRQCAAVTISLWHR
jgi:hypothetical protein